MASIKKRSRDGSRNKVGVCVHIKDCKKSWCGTSKCAKNKCRDYKDPLNPKNRKK